MKQISFRGKTFTYDDVLAAMKRFDKESRASFRTKHWATIYAIQYENKLYPPKQIMRLVTGMTKVGNSGKSLNARFEDLGFTVVSLHTNKMETTPISCEPPIESIRFAEETDGLVAHRLRILFQADQASRQVESPDWDALLIEDRQRRVEILGYLQQGKVNDPESLYYTAFIFQHGNCSDHYQLANQVAERALKAGYERARWIYAASLDRYLRSIGEPQKYGTQYIVRANKWELQPFDPTTTDEERRDYNVPALAQLLAHADQMNTKNANQA